ncbi:MAG TPA: histidine kinase [Actinomycetota bacterium]|nr:histidine kinase [Actinomycetota bacterium]
MSPARSRILAWSLFAAVVVSLATAGVLMGLGWRTPDPQGAFGFRGFSALYAIAFATVGLVIALRRPEHPIGWMMLASGGLLGATQQITDQYARYTLLGTGTLPGGDVAAWLQDWIWLPEFAMLGLALLLIPDGHLPSSRWKVVAWGLVLATALAAVARSLSPGPIESFREAVNPFGIESGKDPFEVLFAVAMAVAMTLAIATAASLWLRRRRAVGEERAQVRLVVLGAVITTLTFLVYGIVYGLLNTGPLVDLMEVAFVASVIVFAISLGIAILRSRLFDIDVVVSRAVVFGLLAAFITVVYVGLVVGIGALVESRGDALLSAIAAALVAVAFQPVRRWAQRLANRLVYGERATPYEVLSEFGRRVSEGYEAEDVLVRMARILGEGTGSEAAVWLCVGRRLEPAARWPPEGAMPAPVELDGDDELPVLAAASIAVPVRHEGELLGALSVTKPPAEPLTPTEERLVDDLAHQAGLVLRNAALIAELRASRQRLVAAQDEERRRLERNLHDGAQQQLVALSVKLGLLKRVAGDVDPTAEALIDDLQAETQDAVETLRDLARGIYPPLLADRGLRAALEAQARKAALPVEISADGIGRYPQEVEAAVYFCCLEALQNVAKHAGARRAVVRVDEADGVLRFAVADDGVGFDARAAGTSSTGLQGIEDRLSALGGSLEVRTARGEGTTLVGRIPLAG